MKILSALFPYEGASGGIGRKDVTSGQPEEGWWPEDGPDLGEFTWELGLALPI